MNLSLTGGVYVGKTKPSDLGTKIDKWGACSVILVKDETNFRLMRKATMRVWDSIFEFLVKIGAYAPAKVRKYNRKAEQWYKLKVLNLSFN